MEKLKKNDLEIPLNVLYVRKWIHVQPKFQNKNLNHKKSSKVKLDEHIWCGYSMSTIWTLDTIENKHISCLFSIGKGLHEKKFANPGESTKWRSLILKRKWHH